MQIVLKIVQQLSINSPSIWRPQPLIRVNFVDNLVKYTDWCCELLYLLLQLIKHVLINLYGSVGDIYIHTLSTINKITELRGDMGSVLLHVVLVLIVCAFCTICVCISCSVSVFCFINSLLFLIVECIWCNMYFRFFNWIFFCSLTLRIFCL